MYLGVRQSAPFDNTELAGAACAVAILSSSTFDRPVRCLVIRMLVIRCLDRCCTLCVIFFCRTFLAQVRELTDLWQSRFHAYLKIQRNSFRMIERTDRH